MERRKGEMKVKSSKIAKVIYKDGKKENVCV